MMEIVGCVQLAPARANGDVVAYADIGRQVAVGVVVVVLVLVEGGGAVVQRRTGRGYRLPVEELLCAVVVADGGTEAQGLVAVRNLDNGS